MHQEKILLPRTMSHCVTKPKMNWALIKTRISLGICIIAILLMGSENSIRHGWLSIEDLGKQISSC